MRTSTYITTPLRLAAAAALLASSAMVSTACVVEEVETDVDVDELVLEEIDSPEEAVAPRAVDIVDEEEAGEPDPEPWRNTGLVHVDTPSPGTPGHGHGGEDKDKKGSND